MILYTAGPIRPKEGYSYEENIEQAKRIAYQLWQAGYAVICPQMNTNLSECPDYSIGWLEGDVQMIARCDAVVMLPRWEASEGSWVEKHYAEDRGIPVYIWPDVPPLHVTEINKPRQAAGFIDIVMKMYRVHLDKNADYCLAPEGVRVLTGDLRWIPLADVTEGMVLLGFDEMAEGEVHHRRMYRPSTVLSVNHVRRQSYKLTLEDGMEFICSEEHPWLVSSGLSGRWLTTDRLRDKGHGLPAYSRFIKPLDVWEEDTTGEAGYLAGAFDGEGWLSQNVPTGKNAGKRGETFILGFAQNDNVMLKRVEQLLSSRGLTYRKRERKGKNLKQLVLSGHKRRELIQFLGEVRPRRLIANLKCELGMLDLRRKVLLVKKEFIGEHDLIALQTSTGTFIANGYATHNSSANILGTGELGLMTRVWDKVARLMNLMGFKIELSESRFEAPSAPKNEATIDSILDLSVYSIIWMLYRKGVWGK